MRATRACLMHQHLRQVEEAQERRGSAAPLGGGQLLRPLQQVPQAHQGVPRHHRPHLSLVPHDGERMEWDGMEWDGMGLGTGRNHDSRRNMCCLSPAWGMCHMPHSNCSDSNQSCILPPLPLLACLPSVYLNRQATIDGRGAKARGGIWAGGEGTVTLLEHSFVHKLCEFFKLRISIILIN